MVSVWPMTIADSKEVCLLTLLEVQVNDADVLVHFVTVARESLVSSVTELKAVRSDVLLALPFDPIDVLGDGHSLTLIGVIQVLTLSEEAMRLPVGEGGLFIDVGVMALKKPSRKLWLLQESLESGKILVVRNESFYSLDKLRVGNSRFLTRVVTFALE